VTIPSRICADDERAARIAALPRPLVFTNGVFDVLHRGHVEYLEHARSLGNSLVVGVNTDGSARLLGKGPDRPINTAADRAAVLAALRAVTLVLLFDERTPVELVRQVQPDLYVKGGDYTLDQLPEAEVMRQLGGRTVIVPFTPGYSTTGLVARMKAGG
jgi:rfaE bifunctional protein nucleotidyltransferase chain/domain